MDIAAIEARLDLVALFVADGGLREALRTTLRTLPDIGRALGRIAAGRGSPRDLGQLRDGLEGAEALAARLAPPLQGRGWGGAVPQTPQALDSRRAPTPNPSPKGEGLERGTTPTLLADLIPQLRGHTPLIDLLRRALVPMPPIDASDGGYIAEGYDAALDDLRDAGAGGRRAIAALEAKYREQTGTPSLKIRHNGVLGYHIEVAARFADPLMRPDSGFTHRQTLAGVVRFNAPELHEHAIKVSQAGAHALAAEAAHLEDLTAAALDRREPIAATADALARLDV
eukprot:gene11501-15367_t